VSNTPTLQAVGEASASDAVWYTNGLRKAELVSGGGDYAARFQNDVGGSDFKDVRIAVGAAPYDAGLYITNKNGGHSIWIGQDGAAAFKAVTEDGMFEALSGAAGGLVTTSTAYSATLASSFKQTAGHFQRWTNINGVYLSTATHALLTTQGNSRINNILELNEISFKGTANAFSLKPENTPADGAVMTYDSAKDTWTNRFTVNQASKSDGDVLVYRSGQGGYTNEAQSGGLPASATNLMVTFVMTNGWDVSGGGGGIPQWLTNYQFEATYNSNEWMTLSSDVTNVLQFETETYDLGNIYNPATFTATVIKDGRYEAYVMWGMAHSLAASKQMHTFFQTNGFAVGATFRLEGSQVNSQLVKGQSYRRVLKLTSNSTVRACNYFTASGTRLGGGDGDNSNELRHHMSMFSLEYLGP